MSTPQSLPHLHWHDEARVLGIEVRAHFFDPTEVDARPDFVGRYLPVLTQARPRRLGTAEARSHFVVGELSVQPDAVLEHGNGLLCLTHRFSERLFVEKDSWPAQLRVDSMLQCLAEAMAVAGARQLPTAALMRGGNVLFQFAPLPAVLECLATHVTAARRYWNAPKFVSASQLAIFCEPKLRSLPGIAPKVGKTTGLFETGDN